MRLVDWLGLLLTVAIFVYLAGLKWGPPLEGRLMPVVAPAQLLEATPSPPPLFRHRWHARALKLRDECHYKVGSIRWHLGPPDRPQGVYAKFFDKPQRRPAGWLEWRHLVIDLDPEQVRRDSSSTVRHFCDRWWAWWDEVESVFYISPPVVR